ncbi:MAG: rRNA maturation RNAse YbeY, partial [Moorella sp. (in: Bacteria)]|nr:rRNA maturation RNAse YbeY [Moorella sp. (in: firmicutes)]
LHLLGYDHQAEDEKQVMRRKEEAVLEKLGLPR